VCSSECCKKYHKEHTEEARQRGREYYKNHREAVRKYTKEYYLKNTAKAKKYQLKYKYNITVEQYDQMFEEQNGVCAICGKPETTKNQWGTLRLSVDHDHVTGRVRGLLCTRCNNIIGRADDDVTILLNAGIYLEKHRC